MNCIQKETDCHIVHLKVNLKDGAFKFLKGSQIHYLMNALF